jgi:hypothetical protein
MSLAYKIGSKSGKVLGRLGLANAVVATFDGLERLILWIKKAMAVCLGVGLTWAIAFGIYSLYERFKFDFDNPVTINILGEAFLVGVTALAGIGVIGLIWRVVLEYQPTVGSTS